MNKYRVVRDYQGGSFGMDRDYTAEEWLEQMLEWRTADGLDDEDTERERGYWATAIKTPYGESMLIDYIAEIWQLEFKKVKE